MSDDLRTRIAQVLADHDPEGAALSAYHYEVADAVIRELQLTVLGNGIIVGVIVGDSHV